MTGVGGIRSAFAAALGVSDEGPRQEAARDAADGSTATAVGSPDAAGASTATAADASLLALVDRLTDLLERSDLAELEIRAGGTGLVLRKASAPRVADLATGTSVEVGSDGAAGASHDAVGSATRADAGDGRVDPAGPDGAATEAGGQPVLAPLTGIFYTAPSPSAPEFVKVGQEIVAGQVIGLIEAMKLFNEIKSDRAGRVVRIVATTGSLVKAKQPLI